MKRIERLSAAVNPNSNPNYLTREEIIGLLFPVYECPKDMEECVDQVLQLHHIIKQLALRVNKLQNTSLVGVTPEQIEEALK